MSRSSLPPLEDDFSRALLGSAEGDGPSNAAYAKAAAALGIGVGLGVGASLPASAAVAASAVSAAGVARWSSSLVAKLLALGVSGALLVGAGALLLRSSEPAAQTLTKTTPMPGAHAAAPALLNAADPSPRAAAASPSSERARPPVRRAAPAVSPATPPAVRRIGRGISASTSSGHASSGHASSAGASSGSSLAEQVQSLDGARLALRSGNSSAALREIAHYRAAWPDGVFLTEASVLEIEALAARGERSLASTRAADFVAAHPDSPQADRLRALIPSKKAH